MKKTLFIILISIVFIISGCSSNINDQVQNITNKDNKYVLMVKDGHPEQYPKSTYGKSFDKFFGSPTWKYFKSDDKKDVVEFTGKCTYQNVEVKARLQFILNVKAGTFEAGALSFNDVPQNQLVTAALLSKVFEDSSEKATLSSNSNKSDTNAENTAADIDLFTCMGKSKDDIINKFGNPNSVENAQCGQIYKYGSLEFGMSYDSKVISISLTNPGYSINGIEIGMLPSDIKSKNGKPTKEGTTESGFFMDYRLNNDSFSIICSSDDSDSPIKSISVSDLTVDEK